MFGLKCKSNYTYSINNYCTVPQPKSSSTKFYCENQEDKCFNNFKELTCFRCFDGTILLNSQVCDSIIDCHDLSDECTCENSRVKPLCNVFYAKKSLKKTNLSVTAICNLKYEFPDGVDERYCSNQLISTNKRPDDTLNNNLKCAKGSIVNNNIKFAVLSENSFNNVQNIIHGISNDYLVQQPKILPLGSDLNGTTCNNNFECPFREDECSRSCFVITEKYYNYFIRLRKFITCFSFLFKNLEPFLIKSWTGYNRIAESRFYFNDTKLHYLPRPYNESKTTQIIAITSSTSPIKFISTIKNISFHLYEDVYTICRDNLLDCPWYFRCEHDQYQLIEIHKVCDFNFDCKDQSDEKYCSSKTHFNCTAVSPVSIDRRKVNDYELDCDDRSDECR